MKAYVFAAEGFEEVELTTIVDLLRRADIPTQIVSITDQKEVQGAHAITLSTDCTLDDVKLEEASALILPGGMPGALRLGQSPKLADLLIQANTRNTLIGAICAAPRILGLLGLLQGRKATCYKGFEDELIGAELQDQTTVIDGNIITSVGVMSAIEFALTLIERIKNNAASQKVSDAIYVK